MKLYLLKTTISEHACLIKSQHHNSLTRSTLIKCYNNSLQQHLYIYKRNLSALSPRQPLIGSSWDFTRKQGRSRAWKNQGL